MSHFDILCSLLKQSHRNLSNHQIRKLAKLSSCQFYRQKQDFVFPLQRVIEISRKQPVRVILDYVLISRKLDVINRPFAMVHNPATSRYEPCLVILFGIAESQGQIYPIAIDFWEQQCLLEQEGDTYFDKIELAENLVIQLLQAGLAISELLFDAGFCQGQFLKTLNHWNVPYICRFPRRWRIQSPLGLQNAKRLFPGNGSFYYDRHLGCYLNKQRGRFADHDVLLVVSAKQRQDFLDKKFYCLLTNQTNLLYTKVLRHYMKRGQIEKFFRQLKTYLGLAAFNRHHEDYALIPHIQLRCAGYVLLQAFATTNKVTLAMALEQIQRLSFYQIQRILKPYWLFWEQALVITTTQTLDEAA